MAEGEKAKKVKAPKILIQDPAHLRTMYDTLREEWFTFLEIIQEQSKRIGQLEEQLESNQVRSQDWMNAVTGMEDRAKAAEARLKELENALTWDTTCLNCAKVLDESIKELERRETAEKRVDIVRKQAEEWANLPAKDDWGHDSQYEELIECGRRLLTLLGDPDKNPWSIAETPGCDCGHHGMLERWHARDCQWITSSTDES